MGPLVTREHRDKVAGYLDAAREQGATVVTDGREDAAFAGDGFFLGVSLIDDVRPDMACYTDEIFGPVLSVVRASSYDEALGMVNDNPYGNGVAIFTRDGGAARQFQFDVNVGMVGVNVPIPVPVSYYSFGGWKSSLFGDQHMYGPDGIKFYTRRRSSRRGGPIRAPAASTSGSRGRVDGRRDELLDREEAAWARMWAQVERVPAGARAREGVVGDWSVQDMVWHCARWADFCGEYIDSCARDRSRPVRERARRALGSHEPGDRRSESRR